MTSEQLIIQQRAHIDQAVNDLAKRYYLALEELEEFRAMVDRALERNDYELLRAHDDRSSWQTYLTTVVMRQFFIFQAQIWGQWRPTLTAQRLGPEAMLLEELIVRDHLDLEDAIDIMRRRHRVDVPRPRLERMANELRLADEAERQTAADVAQGPLRDARIQTALRDALALISADDRLMLELRLRDGQPVTRIARMLKIEPRPLQRRIDQALETVRSSLLAHGISHDDVDILLRGGENHVALCRRWWNFGVARPSHE